MFDTETPRPRTYALVGCGKSKHPGRRPAREKYSSDYFEKKRAYAEKHCEHWWILSAKYGAIPPWKEINDYDVTIDDVDPESFARSVYIALRADDSKWINGELEVLAGQAYIEPIRDVLDGVPCPVRFPFDGTQGIGEQKQWLASNIGTEHEPSQMTFSEVP